MIEKTDPIRVAQVVGPVVLGGVDTMVMNYYRHIDRNKVQFDFIMDGYYDTPIDDEIRDMGGKIYKVEPYADNMVKSMRQYYQIFKENQYPIVHSHMNTLNIFPLFEAWRAGVPVRIAHSHSTVDKGEGKRAVMKYVLRPFAKIFPTHYCACSEHAGRWLFGEKLFESGKIHLIKNAIDLNRFSYKPEVREKMRSELGLKNKFVVGHVGRFMYQKNHEFLIDIFNEIYHRNPNSELLLIGDGPRREQIQNKVNQLGLSDAVIDLGLRKDISDLYQAMDVFVLPSFYEGFGMAALEAQAEGLPTVVSEAIPKEAQITKLLTYCCLSQTASEWAKRTLSYERMSPRGRTAEEIKNAGFDILTAAEDMTNSYQKINYSKGR